jgi:O-antigen/teichoic acid export membrane protein
MPFIMARLMMGGFYKIPSLILGFHKKVLFYPFLSAFAFGINALLNWYLIPLYGIVGAGFASFVGLFLYSSVLQLISFKFFTSKYKLKIYILYLSILVTIIYLFLINYCII